MRVLIGILLWGMAEIAAFVVVGSWIGVVGVLAVVMGSALAGVMVLRGQGLRRVTRLQDLGPAGITMAGAVLLIMPGLFGDLAGAALLIPAVQRLILSQIAARVRMPEPDFLDGIAVEVEAGPAANTDQAPRLPSGWTRP